MVDAYASGLSFSIESRSRGVAAPFRRPAFVTALRSLVSLVLEAISLLAIFAGGYLALLLS